MYNGILPVYKERGLTSHDVVFKLRKILKTKKVGHTGTLDPEVAGVLPVCIGNATKVSDYIMDMGKSYQATVYLGKSTTTEDQTGETLAVAEVTTSDINTSIIDDVLQRFHGEIKQIPPMYSSVKVNGKKLYEYARKNIEVERPERTVNIKDIQRTSDLTFDQGGCQFDIFVTCGKGTYIRTLATDIGKEVNIPAHMSQLTRVDSGGFALKDSYKLHEIAQLVEQETLQAKLFPIEYGLKGLQQIVITEATMQQKILNGQKFNKRLFDEEIANQVAMINATDKKVLAIYEPHPEKQDEIKPKKVFN
ncbi:tRNA pseudouridine(55) synthase TruB [Staphylococcus gallinarum]|uniref:tRNA pseudouridine(55) synthase TruB n=1 Tax=Staphylococcus gallinarum TaxID=1293 RepID=UPI001E650B2B|nr:tRNA pseudouridine(55) synthase TruB [Staphylococcus gallinarum]MCD8843193.1 tRNA pseudouridine(55) synthase TruB [Staphylococcus gallinarum]